MHDEGRRMPRRDVMVRRHRAQRPLETLRERLAALRAFEVREDHRRVEQEQGVRPGQLAIRPLRVRQRRRRRREMPAGGAAPRGDALGVHAEFPRVGTHPAQGIVGVRHGVPGMRPVTRRDPIVRDDADHAPVPQRLRLTLELRGRAGSPAAPEEEHRPGASLRVRTILRLEDPQPEDHLVNGLVGVHTRVRQGRRVGEGAFLGRGCNAPRQQHAAREPSPSCVHVPRSGPRNVVPPSTTSTCPVMYRAWSEARKRTAWPMSQPVPSTPRTEARTRLSRASGAMPRP